MIRFALVFVAVFGLLASAADARATSCRDGRTVHKRAGVRVFEVTRAAGDTWYACGPRARRPVRLYSSEASYGSFSVFGRAAGRVLFVGEFSGEGGGEDTTVGWFDGRRARSGDLAGGVSNDVLELLVGADGGIGVVSASDEGEDARVGYLAPGRDELALAVVGGRYAKGSLAFAGGALTFARTDGVSRTVPLRGERVACDAGLTRLEHEGARVFEVLPNRKARRGGFQADVLAVCLPGAAAARELAVSEVRDQSHWELRSLKRAGARVAFLAGRDGVGVLDAGGALQFARATAFNAVYDVAAGDTGAPVLAGRTYDGNRDAVARVDGTVLAPLGGDFEPGSLAVVGARATWRTRDGAERSAPLVD